MQLRNYILTINNEKKNDDELFNYIQNLPHIKYFIFQREKGKNGTEHIQLYIEFSCGKTFDTMKFYFPTAHIEKRYGTKTQARDYCKKEDTRISENYYEFGDFVEERARTDWVDILEMIKNGHSDIEIAEEFPSQYMRYQNSIRQTRESYLYDKFRKKWRQLNVTYIWGQTGTGKTRYVMDKYGYENVYRITNYDNSAFDSYKGEDIIIFEEFRSSFRCEQMLNYLDGYPIMLPSRYNNKVACYTQVYIITNIPISEQYKNIQIEQPATYKAFTRRIHKVKKMGLTEQTKLLLCDKEDLPFVVH